MTICSILVMNAAHPLRPGIQESQPRTAGSASEAPSSQRLALGTVALACSTIGRGSPVLLIHGLGSSQRDWEAQIPALAPRHRVVSFDQRGHGKSAPVSAPYTMRDLAADAAAVIRSHGAAPCHVVGLSLGGMVAFQLALDEPGLVRSLVIVNSGPEVVPRAAKEHVAIFARRVLSRLLPMRWLGALLSRRLFPHENQSKLRADFVARFAENHKPSYLRAVSAILGWSVAHRLESLAQPVLVVSGDRDYTPTARKRLYVERLPRATMEIVKDSGHATPVDQPAEFNRLVLDFLGRVDGETIAAE